MAIVAQQIDLQTNCETTTLRLANVEKYSDGSGYVCDLSVRSNGFSCEHRFYFDDDSLKDAIKLIQHMLTGTPGEATIKDRYDDDFLRFEMNRLGHVFVSGELHYHADLSQLLSFAFRTDQTVFAPFAQELTAVHNA